MELDGLKCSNCGSHSLKKINGFEYQCEHCGITNYAKGADIKLIEQQQLVINAYSTLRKRDFTTADEEFSNILEKYPNNYDAMCGSIAARYGIVFVEEDGKIYPTFNDILENDFTRDIRFTNFLDKVPKEKRKVYNKLGDEIEKNRIKCFELVQNEEPYDIFISFKASDEKGNKTEDLFEAQNLYTELTQEGYKVFFSPVSLNRVQGSDYEPYIYHALRT